MSIIWPTLSTLNSREIACGIFESGPRSRAKYLAAALYLRLSVLQPHLAFKQLLSGFSIERMPVCPDMCGLLGVGVGIRKSANLIILYCIPMSGPLRLTYRWPPQPPPDGNMEYRVAALWYVDETKHTQSRKRHKARATSTIFAIVLTLRAFPPTFLFVSRRYVSLRLLSTVLPHFLVISALGSLCDQIVSFPPSSPHCQAYIHSCCRSLVSHESASTLREQRVVLPAIL